VRDTERMSAKKREGGRHRKNECEEDGGCRTQEE
jgi:hypothetical protein